MAKIQGHMHINAHTQAKTTCCEHAKKKEKNIYVIAGGKENSKFKSHLRNPKGNDDRSDHINMLNFRRSWDENANIYIKGEFIQWM